MLLVQTESEQIFRMYFNPKVFRRVRTHENIRGIRNAVLIRFGRWWLATSDHDNNEITEQCKCAAIPIVEVDESR